jgi:hypothetical protein
MDRLNNFKMIFRLNLLKSLCNTFDASINLSLENTLAKFCNNSYCTKVQVLVNHKSNAEGRLWRTFANDRFWHFAAGRGSQLLP